MFGRRLQAPASIARSIGRHVDTMERVQDTVAQVQTRVPEALNTNLLTAALLIAQNNPAAPTLSNTVSSSDAMPLAIAVDALSNQYPLDTASSTSNLLPAVVDPVSQVSDGRKYKPVNNFTTSSGRSSRLSVGKSFNAALPYGIELKSKLSALLCIRRFNRRGVILALGKGGGSHARPRRNQNSNIWC